MMALEEKFEIQLDEEGEYAGLGPCQHGWSMHTQPSGASMLGISRSHASACSLWPPNHCTSEACSCDELCLSCWMGQAPA